MEKRTGDLTMFRYEFVHGDDSEFIVYQRLSAMESGRHFQDG